MNQLARALAASVVLAGVLVGAPILLASISDPLTLFSTNWRTAILRPDDGTLLLALLGAVGWAAWLILTISILAEVVSVLSHRRIDLTVPGTGWLRPAIGALVAAAFVAPATLSHATPPPAPSQLTTTIEEAGDDSSSEVPLPETRTHLVQPGDELWSVAETHLGDGERWRELLELNPELTPTTHLDPGAVIHLPTDVSVRSGDTLWDLAQQHLGDGARWAEIHALNSTLITDPDHLEVGWRLVLPSRDIQVPPPAEPSAQPPAHVPPAPPPVDPEATPEEPALHSPTIEAPTTADLEDEETASVEPEHVDDSEVTGVLGPMGGLLAGALFIGISTRRRLQLMARAVGQRLIPLSPEASRFWTALGHRASTDTSPSMPPTAVILGWDDTGDVIHELESNRHLSLQGLDAPSALTAIFTTLIAAPWAADVEVVLVGDDLEWADSLDEPRVTQIDDTADALEQLTQTCARRRVAIGTAGIDDLRQQPDRAPSFAPIVFLFSRELSAMETETLRSALTMGHTGVSVVTLGSTGSAVVQYDKDTATVEGRSFSPQLIEAPARRALVTLFASTLDVETEPAPWWNEGLTTRTRAADCREMNHPYLVLLGEPEMLNAQGTPPQRARGRCLEYCAWLLEHPGSTSTFMAGQLFVAESTRRSNMSRLRKWLGADANGTEYLPDAYSGRIELDQRVTSDWEEFRSLLADGVVNSPERTLRRALTLVKGPVMGNLGQEWPWAGQLREDMESMIVDVACELADRSIANLQFEQARWALELASNAAPHHDEVELRLIRVHRTMADHAYADEAVERFRSRLREENRELTELKMGFLHEEKARSMVHSARWGEARSGGGRHLDESPWAHW